MKGIEGSPRGRSGTAADEDALRVDRLRCLIVALWGVILAKCCALEYLMQTHYAEDPPVNTALYVWALTLTFAIAGSWVFRRIWLRESVAGRHRIGTPGRVWGVAVALTLLAAVAGLATPLLDAYRIPLVAAILLAAAFFVHGTVGGRRQLLAFGAGWCAGAVLLLANPGVPALGLFAGLLIVLLVLPALLLMPPSPRRARQHGGGQAAATPADKS